MDTETKPEQPSEFEPARPRFFSPVLTVAAVIVLAIIGVVWWQSSVDEPTVDDRPPVREYVDRGFSERDVQIYEERRDALLAELAEKEAAGEEDVNLYLRLGNIYYQGGELAESVRWYDKILADLPEDAPALQNKGQSQKEMNDFSAAEETWRKALEVDPLADYYIRLSNMLTKDMDQPEDGLAVLEDAVSTLGQTKGLMQTIGVWYRDQGDLERAVSHFEIASQLDPDDQAVKRSLEKLRAQLAEEREKDVRREAN